MPTDLKTTNLPDASSIMERLTSVCDDPYFIERFYPKICERAGDQLNGQGVVIMLQLAIIDFTDGMPLVMQSTLNMHVVRWAEALLDDEDMKADARELIESARESAASEPIPPRTEMSLEDATALFAQVMRLEALYDECTAPAGRKTSEGYRVGGANPFYDQTDSGLFLEFYYGTVSKVWTPWGSYHFAAAQGYHVNLDAFMSKITVREHAPLRVTANGEVGPVYAILAIDGEELPEPRLLTDRRQFTSYEDTRSMWEQLLSAWRESH